MRDPNPELSNPMGLLKFGLGIVGVMILGASLICWGFMKLVGLL